MKKQTYQNPIVYRYEPTKTGAKYSIDGIRYCNLGNLLESIAKAHRGLEYLVNPTTKWNEGSDIESEKASVKSGKASLACIYGEDITTILDTFFNGVASEKFIYMVMVDDQVSEYEMNANEFREFVERFGRLVKESGSPKHKVQLLATSHKTIAYLEERVGAQSPTGYNEMHIGHIIAIVLIVALLGASIWANITDKDNDTDYFDYL